MKKLSDYYLNRIINRYTCKNRLTHPTLNEPYQSDNLIIASNGHSTLFLTNNLIDRKLNDANNQLSVSLFKQLENTHIDNTVFYATTSLRLDRILLRDTTKWLKGNLKECTKVRIMYNNKKNEIILTTLKADGMHSGRVSYILAPECENICESFSVYVSAKCVVNALTTQRETNQFTNIEHDNLQRDHIRLSNGNSTIIINTIK